MFSKRPKLQTIDTQRVKFISSDQKDIQLASHSFDSVIFIEASGLMSKEDEFKPFENFFYWLMPGGKFIIDCPESVELKNSWIREFPSGKVRGVSVLTKQLESRISIFTLLQKVKVNWLKKFKQIWKYKRICLIRILRFWVFRVFCGKQSVAGFDFA